MAKFMLLLHSSEDGWKALTPEQMQQQMQKYNDWAAKLRSEDRMQGGDALRAGGSTVRRRGGEVVVDGPFAETKESVGGYFLISAGSLAEASEIGKECPVLDTGGFVEVREIDEM
jgi:hypothetical protein